MADGWLTSMLFWWGNIDQPEKIIEAARGLRWFPARRRLRQHDSAALRRGKIQLTIVRLRQCFGRCEAYDLVFMLASAKKTII